MKRLFAGLLLLAAACTKQELADVNSAVQAALPLEQCVVGQIEGGNTNPLAIGEACGGLIPSTVIAIASAFDNSATTDAGAPASAKVHAFVMAHR